MFIIEFILFIVCICVCCVVYCGYYDCIMLYVIFDEVYVCYIVFVDEYGVYCIFIVCWCEGDYFYIYGFNGSWMFKLVGSGVQVCVIVMYIDGLVLVCLVFNYLMNYWLVVIYGVFEVVLEVQKIVVFDIFMEVFVFGCL